MSKRLPKNTLNKMVSFMFPSFKQASSDEIPDENELHEINVAGSTNVHTAEEGNVYRLFRRALEKYPVSSDKELNSLTSKERAVFEDWYRKALKKYCALLELHGYPSKEMEYLYATLALLDPDTFHMSFEEPWSDPFSRTSVSRFFEEHDHVPEMI